MGFLFCLSLIAADFSGEPTFEEWKASVTTGKEIPSAYISQNAFRFPKLAFPVLLTLTRHSDESTRKQAWTLIYTLQFNSWHSILPNGNYDVKNLFAYAGARYPLETSDAVKIEMVQFLQPQTKLKEIDKFMSRNLLSLDEAFGILSFYFHELKGDPNTSKLLEKMLNKILSLEHGSLLAKPLGKIENKSAYLSKFTSKLRSSFDIQDPADIGTLAQHWVGLLFQLAKEERDRLVDIILTDKNPSITFLYLLLRESVYYSSEVFSRVAIRTLQIPEELAGTIGLRNVLYQSIPLVEKLDLSFVEEAMKHDSLLIRNRTFLKVSEDPKLCENISKLEEWAVACKRTENRSDFDFRRQVKDPPESFFYEALQNFKNSNDPQLAEFGRSQLKILNDFLQP